VKIVDAFWEQRNLGVTCTELLLDDGDTVAAVEAALGALTGQYQVAKVPVARYDLMTAVENKGFSFIEGSMNVVHNLKNIALTGLQKRLNDAVISKEMDEADVGQLYAELKKGVFTTDRVYLDKAFTNEQAAQRYVYWLEDEHARGAQLYKLLYKDQAVGFYIFKETADGGCYPFLSGLYGASTKPGLGNILLHKIIEEAARRGLKSISSYISSNNLPMVKVHISEGFTIANIHYVYIKHAAN
jgi:L-amino acid N-acyltransferase YncA